MDISRRTFCGLLATVAAGAWLGLGGCGSTPGFIQTSFFAFDTACAVGGVMPQKALDEAVERCAWFEGTFSAHSGDSDIGRINAAAGAPVQVEAETVDLIAKALHYCEESDGLFDITIGAVSLLWDFKEGVVPEASAIEAALPHVNWRNVHVEGTTVRMLDPLAKIDLGGIAKGYVADRLLGGFKEQGIASAYVNLGGNVAVMGAKEDGTAWRIGVRSPQQGSDEVIATVESEGGSLVTSGLYERRFERDGRAYWHILDPRTGYPASSDILSASIYARESIDGDGFTKPLFMMGCDDALAFLEQRGLQGLLIDAQGGFHATEGATFAF